MKKECPEVAIARKAVETFIKSGKIFNDFDSIPNLPEELLIEKTATFVCIKKGDCLRGCIGTISPIKTNVAEEIVLNAISAATRDLRFPPVEESELPELNYTVDILEKPEPISDKSFLDPKRYGVIVESGRKCGLLLPDLEGVDTVDCQIAIAVQKAGIFFDEPVKLYRFKVRRCE